MASYNYNIHGMSPDLSGRIKLVVKDLHNNKSSVDIKQFRNILRYKEVVPHLARLLNAGGIWTLDCEKAFERLVQSRIQQAILYIVKACADQAEAINAALSGKPYHITHILENGEKTLSQGRVREALADGSKKGIESTIHVSSKVFDTIERVVFNDHSTPFGFVLISPIMLEREKSRIGSFLKSIKNIYAVIVLYFMGPEAAINVVPRGGRMIDDYPINYSNHIEGVIMHHWNSHKVTGCTISDAEEVPRFIWEQVVGCWHKLENDRYQRLNFVDSNGIKREAVAFLGSKLENLLQNSDDWRRVLKTIEAKVMPAFADYSKFFVPPLPDVAASSSSRQHATSAAYDKETHKVKKEHLENRQPGFVKASTLHLPASSSSAAPVLALDGLEITGPPNLNAAISNNTPLALPASSSDRLVPPHDAPFQYINPMLIGVHLQFQPSPPRLSTRNPATHVSFLPTKESATTPTADVPKVDKEPLDGMNQPEKASHVPTLLPSPTILGRGSRQRSTTPVSMLDRNSPDIPPPGQVPQNSTRTSPPAPPHDLCSDLSPCASPNDSSKCNNRARTSPSSPFGDSSSDSSPSPSPKNGIDRSKSNNNRNTTPKERIERPNTQPCSSSRRSNPPSKPSQHTSSSPTSKIQSEVRGDRELTQKEGPETPQDDMEVDNNGPDITTLLSSPEMPTTKPGCRGKRVVHSDTDGDKTLDDDPASKPIPKPVIGAKHSDADDEDMDQLVDTPPPKNTPHPITSPVRPMTNKKWKDRSGHIPRVRQKREAKGKKTFKSKETVTDSEADDELEPKVINRPATPIPNDRSASSPAASQNSENAIASLLEESSAMLKTGLPSSSRLDAAEASQILAAVLALTEMERDAFLKLSHNELLEGFQTLAKKKLKKRRGVNYATSPRHKRARN